MNLNTFLWLAILLFYLGLPPIFEKKNADRGKLPSCFTERLKNYVKCLIWILFGTKQFVFNGTSEASSVVKWDFFEWFLTTIFWKEKYRKIFFSNTVQTEEMKLILNPLGILMTLEMHHHSSTSYPTFTIKVALLLQSAHLLSKLVQKVVSLTLWFLLEYVPKALFYTLQYWFRP